MTIREEAALLSLFSCGAAWQLGKEAFYTCTIRIDQKDSLHAVESRALTLSEAIENAVANAGRMKSEK